MASDINRRQRTLQASILVGAALGFAIAQNRGGSALAGIALGAFAGGIAASAVEFARYLFRQSNGDLGQSYDLATSTIGADEVVFRRENVPLVETRAALVRDLVRTGGASDPRALISRIEATRAMEEATTVPLEAYQRAAPLYTECVVVLPRIALQNGSPSVAPDAKNRAESAAESFGDVVETTVRNEFATIQRLERDGIVIQRT